MSERAIPGDGVTDAVAVQVAAGGQRRLRLTPVERRLAARLIAARGGTACQVARLLGTSSRTAHTLAGSIAANSPRLGVVG